jgi:hypothetical protein
MKKTILLVAFIAALAFSAGAARAQESDAAEPATGTVETPACPVSINGIVGTVETQLSDAEDKEAWAPAELNQCMNIGDHVRTGGDGKVAIRYGDGIQLRANATSTLTIAKSDDATTDIPDSIGMDMGELFTEMDKAKAGENAQFKVNTPSGVVAVRGTQFNVLIDADGKSKVNVLEGVVEVFNELGKVLAEAGFATEIMKGELPLDPAQFNIEEFQNQLNQWKDTISIGKVLGAVKEKINEKKDEIKDKVNIKKKLGF